MSELLSKAGLGTYWSVRGGTARTQGCNGLPGRPPSPQGGSSSPVSFLCRPGAANGETNRFRCVFKPSWRWFSTCVVEWKTSSPFYSWCICMFCAPMKKWSNYKMLDIMLCLCFVTQIGSMHPNEQFHSRTYPYLRVCYFHDGIVSEKNNV
jgi:hypothetical protein